MPIRLRESKSPVNPGSSVSETSEVGKLKLLATALHETIRKMTATIRKLKADNQRLTAEVRQKDSELVNLKRELQRITKGRGKFNDEFGDI